MINILHLQQMTDWVTLKDDISNKFMLVRKSKVSPTLVEAFSIDMGFTEVFAPTEDAVRAVLRNAIQSKTYKETGHVMSGNYYLKLRKNAGLDDLRHWIHKATALFFSPPPPVQVQLVPRDDVVVWAPRVQKGTRARDFSVTIQNDVAQVTVPKWHDEVFPDGVCPVVPSFQEKGFYVLIHPEQLNFRAVSKSPFYESVPQDAWKEIASLGTKSKSLMWPGMSPPEPMATWLFGLARHPTRVGRHVAILHLEKHEHSVAFPCFKALAISYTDDEARTFTPPQIAVSFPLFERRLERTWSGTGDCSSLIWHEAGQRWLLYCYSAQSGGGITVASSSDPSAAAGTWKLLKNGQFTVDALSNQPYDTILREMSCGNPWVGWSVALGCFVIMGAPWGSSNVLAFATSDDGVNWSKPKQVPFDSPRGATPVYPSLVGGDGGGSEWIGERARLYYADSRPDGKRKLKVRTIEIKRANP